MKSPKTTVTLEDLLRLKRAERPPAEFWNEFDRELRSKQLAAIVEPRPWWAPLIRVGARFSHLQLPIGAAAILAVTLVSVRQYDGRVSTPVESSGQATQYKDLAQPERWTESVTVASSSTSDTNAEESQIALDTAPLAEFDETALASVVELEAEAMPSAPELGLELEPSPSARYIAANLAAAQQADPGLMDEVFGHSLRHAQSRQPIRDPLAHVNSPGESRRARLLATALPVSAASNDLASAPNDRIARRLTEDRLYDNFSRVGVKGDRVAIKF